MSQTSDDPITSAAPTPRQAPAIAPLSRAVGLSMRPVEVVSSDTSLDRAASLLRNGNAPALPVSKNGTLLGVVTQRTLADALSRSANEYDPVETALAAETPTISVYESGAEALRRLAEGTDDFLLVLAGENRVAGIVTASDLYFKQPYSPRPPMVGGMATPFGVYLTTGALGAGASAWALVSTGIAMFLVFAVGMVIAMTASNFTSNWSHQDLWTGLWGIFPLPFLFITMRLSPLAGIHAAEHKVVHAIERGEALVPEVVGRMPRVHPRCGTNLSAGAMIFVGVYEGLGGADESIKLLCAAIATFLLWRPVGSVIQFLFTTREPNAKQLDMGIKSGRELLDKYRLNGRSSANPFLRIWNSGMIHVLAGFLICQLLAWGVARLFHLDATPFLN